MFKQSNRTVITIGILLLSFLIGCTTEDPPEPQWPEITSENKPWTRWWWQGSAVDKENLTMELESFKEANIGGVEITPIYGVAGYEDEFIDFLSPEWMEMLTHTLQKGDSLDIGVDMATGTGWPFGGPMVGEAEAAKYVNHETYELQEGESLSEPVELVQESFVYSLGNRMFGVESGSAIDPGKEIELDDLEEPVSANDNLQSLALEQVRFDKPLSLITLMAYSNEGESTDLTDSVDTEGNLAWTAPEGNWTLYAIFQGIHGKMVERAGPGGEGLAIDHFDEEVLTDYLAHFDEAFSDYDISGLRSFFNDSYEVDDANGEANWTPHFLDEFEQRRGYDLREHLPALLGESSDEKNSRVLSDYRQTVSDLLLDEFTRPWNQWADGKEAHIRNQAHGSPANILDLYGASDIPETEGTDIFRAKMASSAANVTGKQLVGSESATWLDEHFSSTLSDVKTAIDRFFLGGVNHIVYHGTAYSPQGEEWPGWLFYAAVHFNPQNPFWDHFKAFNEYVARTQSFLQRGNPDNDVLLYFPIHDQWAETGPGLLEHFDGGIENQFEGTAFKEATEEMQSRGYGFDYISDRQLQQVASSGQQIQASNISYKTLLIPASKYIPVSTFERIVDLANSGATVLFYQDLPSNVAGWSDLESNRERFQELVEVIGFSNTEDGSVQEAEAGDGRFLLGDNLDELLEEASVVRESMTDRGLEYLRRSHEEGNTYFITNWGEQRIDEWIPLGVSAESAVLFDPMNKQKGFADFKSGDAGNSEVHLQLEPGQSMIVQTYQNGQSEATYPYIEEAGQNEPLEGTWSIEFIKGGPELPEPVEVDSLKPWTEFDGDAVENFSGTASYSLSFNAPDSVSDGWVLNLGEVEQSARVALNGQDLGVLTGPVFKMYIDQELIEETNELEIEVANLMANRIAYLDREGISWKKFYNINMSAWEGQNRNENGIFDASEWEPRPSGLLGPVTLTPVNHLN